MTEKALPTMEDLVALVREHSAEEPYSRQRKKILDEKLPGWESLVKSKENWPKIEELCRDDQGLAEVFLKAAGLELALKWFKEGSNAQEQASKNWLRDRGPFEGAFTQLNRCQSKPYWTYQEFKDTSKASIFQSLEHLRNLGRPAGLEDLKQFSASFGA